MPRKLKLKKIPVSKPPKEFGPMEDPTPSIFPPSFHVDEMQMPEIKNWKVGEKYRLVIDVEQKSKSENRKDKVNASLDIIAYKWIKPKTIDEMSDEEFGDHLGEELDKASKQ